MYVSVSGISVPVAVVIGGDGVATREIARNVQEAARGTERVMGNIRHVREDAGQIASAAPRIVSAAD